MDDRKKESISALMDDEANEIELQRLLSKEDPEALLKTWRRYHLMRDVLNGHEGLNVQVDVSAAVRAEIDRAELAEEFEQDGLSDGAFSHSDPSALPELSQLEGKVINLTDNKLSSIALDDTALDHVASGQASNKDSQKPTPITGAKNQRLRYSSFAVAACLMLAVVLDLGFESPSLDGNSTSNDGLVVNVLTGAQSANFNEYLLRHSESSAVRTSYGMAPLIRVASVNSVGI